MSAHTDSSTSGFADRRRAGALEVLQPRLKHQHTPQVKRPAHLASLVLLPAPLDDVAGQIALLPQLRGRQQGSGPFFELTPQPPVQRNGKTALGSIEERTRHLSFEQRPQYPLPFPVAKLQCDGNAPRSSSNARVDGFRASTRTQNARRNRGPIGTGPPDGRRGASPSA